MTEQSQGKFIYTAKELWAIVPAGIRVLVDILFVMAVAEAFIWALAKSGHPVYWLVVWIVRFAEMAGACLGILSLSIFHLLHIGHHILEEAEKLKNEFLETWKLKQSHDAIINPQVQTASVLENGSQNEAENGNE